MAILALCTYARLLFLSDAARLVSRPSDCAGCGRYPAKSVHHGEDADPIFFFLAAEKILIFVNFNW